MSTAVAAKLLTAEEFAALPEPLDGSRQELVKGVVIAMPPPSTYPGVCCNRIGRKIGNFADERNLGFVANNDSGVILERDPDTVRGPDVAFWSRERLPELPAQGYVGIAPDLVVEVLSPSDLFPRVLRKVQQYLQAGVRLIWIVVPDDRSVTIFRPGAPEVILGERDTLTGGDVLPGFTCLVGELFP
jgi:Uma2 family endonuclease